MVAVIKYFTLFSYCFGYKNSLDKKFNIVGNILVSYLKTVGHCTLGRDSRLRAFPSEYLKYIFCLNKGYCSNKTHKKERLPSGHLSLFTILQKATIIGITVGFCKYFFSYFIWSFSPLSFIYLFLISFLFSHTLLLSLSRTKLLTHHSQIQWKPRSHLQPPLSTVSDGDELSHGRIFLRKGQKKV